MVSVFVLQHLSCMMNFLYSVSFENDNIRMFLLSNLGVVMMRYTHVQTADVAGI